MFYIDRYFLSSRPPFFFFPTFRSEFKIIKKGKKQVFVCQPNGYYLQHTHEQLINKSDILILDSSDDCQRPTWQQPSKWKKKSKKNSKTFSRSEKKRLDLAITTVNTQFCAFDPNINTRFQQKKTQKEVKTTSVWAKRKRDTHAHRRRGYQAPLPNAPSPPDWPGWRPIACRIDATHNTLTSWKLATGLSNIHTHRTAVDHFLPKFLTEIE